MFAVGVVMLRYSDLVRGVDRTFQISKNLFKPIFDPRFFQKDGNFIKIYCSSVLE